MSLKIVKPNVEKFIIRPDKNDEIYQKCMWEDITLDYDSYSISGIGDCGNYSYKWSVTPDETFEHLCLRMLDSSEYLLEKFSHRSVFNLEESKMSILSYGDFNDDVANEISQIQASNDREWVDALSELGIEEAYEYIDYDYPAGAKVFVRLLKDIVLPAMRERK